MHIPPYHKKRSWQILFLGMFIGAVIAYLLVIFMYGSMYETSLSDQMQLQTKVNELTRQNQALMEDKEDLEEKTDPTILSIHLQFLNEEDLHLDRLITHQLEDLLQNELSAVIGREVDSVAENDRLLIDLIEKQMFTIDDLSYSFEVKKISISTKLRLSLQVKLPD